MRGGVTCILAVTAKSIHSSRSIFSSPHWEEVNILRLTLRCKNLLENVVEALQKVFVGSMAPVTVFAHIVSGGSVLLLVIFLLVVKVIVKYGGGFQQVPQLLHLAVDWACGTAHSSATSRGRESSFEFLPEVHKYNIFRPNFCGFWKSIHGPSQVSCQTDSIWTDCPFTTAVSQFLLTQMSPSCY